MTSGRMARPTLAGLVTLAVAVVAGGCGDDGPPRVAATVAGAEVPSERVERLTTQWVKSQASQAAGTGSAGPVDRKQAAKLVLGFVIRSQFLEHLAKQMGVEDQPTPVEALAPSEVPAEEFASAGWSQADFEQALRDARLSKAIGEKLFPTVAVSEVELRQKYDRSAGFFNQTWRSQVRVAYFDAQEPAGTLRSRGLTGDAFDTAAMELGARQVGSLGMVTPVTPLPAPVLDAIAGLQAGQTSEPIPGGGGSLVVLADTREEGAAMTFEQVKPELTKVLEDEQRQRLFYDWFNKQLGAAKVEISGWYGKWDAASQLVT